MKTLNPNCEIYIKKFTPWKSPFTHLNAALLHLNLAFHVELSLISRLGLIHELHSKKFLPPCSLNFCQTFKNKHCLRKFGSNSNRVAAKFFLNAIRELTQVCEKPFLSTAVCAAVAEINCKYFESLAMTSSTQCYNY